MKRIGIKSYTLLCCFATFLLLALTTTRSEAANYFWVNGTGNWSDNFNHWATTSGGTVFHTTSPGLHDNVFFDANSFLQPGDTIYDDAIAVSCNTMNWTGVQNNPVFYFSYTPLFQQGFNPFDYNLRIYGSLILDHNMTWGFSGSVGFVSNLAGNTILSDGVFLNCNLIFDNPNGGWFLSDSLETQNINLNNGSLNTNNQYVKCISFTTGDFLSLTYLNLGTSEIRCSHYWNYAGDADKINASNSRISFEGGIWPLTNSFNSKDSVNYNDVIFYDDGRLICYDSVYIKKIIFNKNAFLDLHYSSLIDTLIFNNPGYSIDATQNNAVVGNHTEVNGTCNGIISIVGGSFRQLAGTANFNYCKFDFGIYATGGAVFTATNSTQNPVAPPTGINFITSPITDLYWVGNSGNWNDPGHWSATSGGAGGSCFPTQFTNVHIDANSFSFAGQTITIDSAARTYCNNLDWSNQQANSKLFCNDSTVAYFFIYGSFALNSVVNFDYRGTLIFKSTSAGNSITTGNNFLNCEKIFIEGLNGIYLLNDSLKIKGQLEVSAGTFQVNGNYLKCRSLISDNFGSVDLINSVIVVNDGLNVLNASGINSTIYILGNGIGSASYFSSSLNNTFSLVESFADISISNNTFGKLILHGNSTIIGDVSIDSLIFNSPGKTLTLVNGTASASSILNLIANGTCNGLITISGQSGFTFYPISIGNAQVSYAYLYNLMVTGNITATNSIDGGGLPLNVTVIPISPQNFYWIGGSGNWDDNVHWSYSSGGASAGCVPTQAHNVFFDANSFSSTGQTVYVPSHPNQGCASMDWTGTTFNPSFVFDSVSINYEFYINGSLTLVPQMNWNVKINLHFGKSNSLKTITSAGHSLTANDYAVFMDGDSLPGYVLGDSLICNGYLYFQKGKFNSASNPITASSINIFNSATLNPPQVYLNVSTVRAVQILIYNYAQVPILFAANATIEAGSFAMYDSLITIGTLSVDYYYGADNYGHLKNLILKKDARLSNSNGLTIDTMLLQNSDYTLFIQDSLRINNYLSINGDAGCEKYCRIQSLDQPLQSSLIVASGIVSADYVAINNINATGGAFFAATHCLDLGNNTGWAISPSSVTNKDYYWIGGAGNWNDTQHWSLSSGGGTAGCFPSRYDNVHFDANSFSINGDTVVLNQDKVYFNNMDWTGVQLNPTIVNQEYFDLLSVGGSLILTPGVNFKVDRDIEFTANDSDNVIQLSGNSLQPINFNKITFSGTGLWNLNDSLSTGQYGLYFDNGSLQSNNNLIRTNIQVGLNGNNKVHLNLGSSDFYGGYRCGDTSRVELNALNTNFYTGDFFGGNYQEYNYVESTGYFGDSCHINKVVCKGSQTYLPQYCNADTLIFENSVALCDINTDSVFVMGKWIIQNDNSHPLRLRTLNNSATIVKVSDTLCFNNLFLKDIHITGGVTAYAGYNSIDIGNNTGWIFGSCAVPVDSVWPGDANYDLVANNIDVLNIGVAYGETGPQRTNPLVTWTPQFASDWSKNFNSGFNYKHADCNGDGVVDNNDTTAISLNYGSTHPFRLAGVPPQITSAPLLYLVANLDTAVLSQALNIDIFLGISALPVDSIYGIAFSINFNPALIDTNSITFDYTGSWLGTAGTDLMTYEKVFAPTGYADVALVRTDHFNSSGFGYLGTMGVVVVDNVTGRIVLPFAVNNITAITYGQTLLDFNTASDSIDIDSTQTVSIHTLNPENEIHIFPVPASDHLYVYSNSNLPMEKIELMSLYGEVVYNNDAISNKQVVNTSEIANGIYLLKCYTRQGLVCKKVEIVHK